jgi:hypothetical protein
MENNSITKKTLEQIDSKDYLILLLSELLTRRMSYC